MVIPTSTCNCKESVNIYLLLRIIIIYSWRWYSQCYKNDMKIIGYNRILNLFKSGIISCLQTAQNLNLIIAIMSGKIRVGLCLHVYYNYYHKLQLFRACKQECGSSGMQVLNRQTFNVLLRCWFYNFDFIV